MGAKVRLPLDDLVVEVRDRTWRVVEGDPEPVQLRTIGMAFDHLTKGPGGYPGGYLPDPDAHVARLLAKELGGEAFDYDPVPESRKGRPGEIH